MAFAVLVSGVVTGWAAWQAAFAPTEAFLAQRLGGAVTAMVLWAMLGIFMVAGYMLALKIGVRFIKGKNEGFSDKIIICKGFR